MHGVSVSGPGSNGVGMCPYWRGVLISEGVMYMYIQLIEVETNT